MSYNNLAPSPDSAIDRVFSPAASSPLLRGRATFRSLLQTSTSTCQPEPVCNIACIPGSDCVIIDCLATCVPGPPNPCSQYACPQDQVCQVINSEPTCVPVVASPPPPPPPCAVACNLACVQGTTCEIVNCQPMCVPVARGGGRSCPNGDPCLSFPCASTTPGRRVPRCFNVNCKAQCH